MKIVYFSHALTSCWNHGNAHFQRGLLRELQAMGHSIAAYEPADSWSRQNLIIDQGQTAVSNFHTAFPGVEVHTYNGTEDVSSALYGAQLAIVHEWTDPAIVAAIGRHGSSTPGLTILFHDTHHRAVSDPAAMRAYDLSAYDGILAFGQSLADKQPIPRFSILRPSRFQIGGAQSGSATGAMGSAPARSKPISCAQREMLVSAWTFMAYATQMMRKSCCNPLAPATRAG